MYLAGRTWLLAEFPDGVTQEIVWTAWRVPFLALYFLLFRDSLALASERRGVPKNPLLAFVLLLAFSDVGFHGPRFAEYQLVLAATTPIIGIREELFYRVGLQGFLERHMSPVAAIVLASVVFTAYHAGSQPMNAVSVTGIFAFGVILGAIYQRTRNLWLVAALHALIDVAYAVTPPLDIGSGFIVACHSMAPLWALVWWRIDLDKASRR